MSYITKISSKGQITLPKEIRNFLNVRIIEFEIEDDRVVIKPVESVAGSLSSYSKEFTDIKEIREKIWQDIANEKTSNPS